MLLSKIKQFFSQGHERSLNAKRNIVASFIIKGLSIIVSVITVPVTLKYLDQNQYGIWLTLSSILSWIMFFDIGLGSGLRNKFAEAKAKDDIDLAKTYVSTSYAAIGIIVVVLFIIFYSLNPFINWAHLLNADLQLNHILSKTMVAVFLFFGMQFLFRLLSFIIIADQKQALNDSLNLLGSIVSLVIILFLAKYTKGSLLLLGITFSATPVLIILIASLFLFNGKYKNVKPSLKWVKFAYLKDLMSLGLQFFAIQISSLVLFSTTNIIISHLFCPAEVVPYNIVNKYFSVIVMSFALITTPLTSPITDAYSRGENDWIKNMVKKVNIVSFLFILCVVIMVICSNFVYKMWVGPSVKIPFGLSLLIGFYTGYTVLTTIYATFITGVGKVKLAFYFGILNSLLYIPIGILFGKLLGIEGLVLAMIVLTLPGVYWLPMQYKKIITNTARGIWNG